MDSRRRRLRLGVLLVSAVGLLHGAVGCTIALESDSETLTRKIRLQCDPDTYMEAEWGGTESSGQITREVTKP